MDLYKSIITLKPGDVVIDATTSESGILLRNVNLFETHMIEKYDMPGIIAWEILWSGSTYVDSHARKQLYTENGLINMIREGLLQLYKNN